MTDLEKRLHTEKIMLPDGFDARQENVLMKAMVSRVGKGHRYRWAIVFASLMTLLIATAAAAGYWGLTHFWKDASPDAVALIESGISQTGGELDDATFVVREAVFDGKTLQAVLTIQATDGRVAVLENQNDNVRDNCVRVDCWLGAIENQKGITGCIDGQYDQEGTLILYISETLEKELDVDRAHISLGCATMTANHERWSNRQSGNIEFEIPRITPKTIEMDTEVDLEGWLSIRHVKVSYTPLGATLEIRYKPETRLGEAMPTFYVNCADDAVNSRYGGVIQREGDAQSGYVLTIQTGLPESLPHSLMLGVRGIKSRIRLDFDRNMAVIEGKGEE